MNLKIAQVIGLNTDQKAAQVVSSVREDIAFLAVLHQACDDAFTKGRQVLSELEDFFFEFEGAPGEKLNAAFREAKNKFENREYDLCLGAVFGKALYLIWKGNVEVYLKREGKLSQLLSIGEPAQLVSGFITPGDKVLFATKNLTAFLGGDLAKSLDFPPDVFEEEVGARISSAGSESQGLAALSLDVGQEAEPHVLEEAEYDNNQEVFIRSGQKGKAFLQNMLGKAVWLIEKGRKYFPKSGRGRLMLAGLLMAVIVSGAGLKYQAGKDRERNLLFEQNINRAKDNFEGAKSMSGLNPADAKNRLNEAKESVNKALKLKPKSIDAQSLKKQIEDSVSSILQQSEVSSFPQFLELELIKKNFKASKMSLNSGKLLILDPSAKTLAAIDIVKKSNEILAGESQLGDAVFASINGGLTFVYSNNKGILKVETKGSKISSVAKSDSEWGAISDIYAFAGNVYALDSGKNQIWKYLPTSDGYSDKRAYLAGGGSATKNTQADFSQSLRMQIESSIYVLKSTGEMLRFTKGDKDTFSYSGLPSDVKEPKSFFVSSDTENLYLLDSGNSRLLILTKTGGYKGEIKGDKFGTASDLAVDEEGKKVYLLEGSKIYTADLK